MNGVEDKWLKINSYTECAMQSQYDVAEDEPQKENSEEVITEELHETVIWKQTTTFRPVVAHSLYWEFLLPRG